MSNHKRNWMIVLGVLLIGSYIFVNMTQQKKVEMMADKNVQPAEVSTSAESPRNVDAANPDSNQSLPSVSGQIKHNFPSVKSETPLNAAKNPEHMLNNDANAPSGGGSAGSSIANPVPTQEEALKGVIAENKRRALLNTAVEARKSKMDEVHAAILAYQAANGYKDNAPNLIATPNLEVPADIGEKIKSHELVAH